MIYQLSVLFDGTTWKVFCAALPGFGEQGLSLDEAVRNFQALLSNNPDGTPAIVSLG